MEKLPGIKRFYCDQQGIFFQRRKAAYGENFEYTFNQQRNYNFKVKESPKMEMTVTVK
jgi:hypothetical protein